MNMIDFEFNEEALSDHNMMIGFFSRSEETTPLGSPLTLETVRVKNINKIASGKYEDPLTKSFMIIKKPCETNGNMIFTEDEIYEISTWLQPNYYCRFKPIYDDGSFADIHFYGRCDIQAVYINADVVGFDVTFTANAPYGFGEEREITYNITTENNGIFRVYNDSQELGYLYFDEFKIICGSSGKLLIKNMNDVSIETGEEYLTRIENCVADEIITLKCQEKIIDTNNILHKDTLMNDFNWNYPRLLCDYVNPLNIYEIDTSEMANCTIVIKFSPIRKVGVI